MKRLIPLLAVCFSACTLLQNNHVVYQAGKALPDTTFVYSLPYAPGKSYRVVQGSHSFFSHRGYFAIDFKMAPGTPVHAARSGVVTFSQNHHTRGGIGRQYVSKGNGIIIRHSDGTYARYWHLKHKGTLVRVGDTVSKGQLIGYSGSTGFSAFPHLHFSVMQSSPNGRRNVPIVFETEKGAKFLQPLHRYKSL